MSDQPNNVALSLQQILLGISDSLTEAQAMLNETPPYDQYGRPNVVYQLPYLDFKLQVASEFESVETQTSETQEQAARASQGESFYRYPKQMIRFKPIQTNETNTVKNEIISTMSGRFVANMPNDGLPQIFLTVQTAKKGIVNGKQQYTVTVQMSNSAGEYLVNSLVELNFDAEASKTLNAEHEVGIPSFNRAEARTNTTGSVTFDVELPILDYTNGRYFTFTANSGVVAKDFSLSKSQS